MNTVPRLFIESVCLCLLDRRSLRESTKIPSAWGQICTATRKKIHTLRVFLDGEKKKIYAAAQPPLLYDAYSSATSLDSVDPKFVTNFWIETCSTYGHRKLPSSYKEITLFNLKRLLHLIRPSRNERPPLCYDNTSLNTLKLKNGSQWINGKLLSMRPPADSVDLVLDEECEGAEEFFASTGPLYHVHYEGPTLKRSTVDALIEKFVPIEGGYFNMHQSFSYNQQKKLFEKCVVANKKVRVYVLSEKSTKSSDLVGLVDYIKYYSKKEVLRQGKIVIFSNEEEEKLEFRMSRSCNRWLLWDWYHRSQSKL
uniref:F-box domain-containing protein n=1 Tax=Steinernema glaseri TaxID=37863 RepID=A0A1I7YLM6_9BILA